MENLDQLTTLMLEVIKNIAAIQQELKNIEDRITEHNNAISGITRLDVRVETLTSEIALLKENLKTGQTEQGRRIGEAEDKIIKLLTIEPQVMANHARLDAIEREPANKWNDLKWKVLLAVASAVVAYIMGKFL